MVGDVGQIIPHNYLVFDNRKEYHHTSISKMEGKLFDQFVSILIDPGYVYSYVSSDLVDLCRLSK